jgi:FkbM family methyltransferase
MLYDRAIARAPFLPFRRKVVWIRLRKHEHRFALRLGSSDALVLKEIFLENEYDTFLGLDLGCSPVILDLGANVGFSVRYWFASIPNASVVAVEPDIGNSLLLRKNIGAIGKEAATTVISKCVLGYSRPVVLDRNHSEWAYRVTTRPESSLGGEVDVTTVQELVDLQCRGRRVDLLKCDIEGAESELFQNCGSWLKYIKYAIVELHPPYTCAQFATDLCASGVLYSILSTKSDGVNTVMLVSMSAAEQ